MENAVETRASSLEQHASRVVKALLGGRVIPFLDAGVNLCGRTEGAEWVIGSNYLPSGWELTQHLAREFHYPNPPAELLRVSQYVTISDGAGPLYEELHKLFDVDYVPTSLHSFLAGLLAVMRSKGYAVKYPLIVTTNYDDVLEISLKEAGEVYDLVYYEAKGENLGKFWHQPPGREPRLIERPNKYRGLSLDERPVILKIHGAVSRKNESSSHDSYVITEDHYIDYLLNTEVTALLPMPLPEKLKRSHYLFLGYGLRDWNLRVILRRIWKDQALDWKSWAVKHVSDPIDDQFWKRRKVDIIGADLQDDISALRAALEGWPSAGGQQ
jgi:hypothetical protein